MTPSDHPQPSPMVEMTRLKQIIDRLRSPGGCPWDLAQTADSLRPYLLEEAHEAAEAISSGDPERICEELGDLLMNIHLQARIGEESGAFTLENIARDISEKLIRRHPHVFADGVAEDAEAVRRAWDQIKSQEKGDVNQHSPTIRTLPASLPALARADRIGKMAAEVGFDWPALDGARNKLTEELAELDEAVSEGNRKAIHHEIGDLLFAASSISRKLDIDPEQALNDSLERFRHRFTYIDEQLGDAVMADLEQLEEWYQQGKNREEEATDGN